MYHEWFNNLTPTERNNIIYDAYQRWQIMYSDDSWLDIEIDYSKEKTRSLHERLTDNIFFTD